MKWTSKEAEYSLLARKHRKDGDEYATRSHKVEGEIADGYSSLAEAHYQLAAVFSKLSGGPQIQEREP